MICPQLIYFLIYNSNNRINLPMILKLLLAAALGATLNLADNDLAIMRLHKEATVVDLHCDTLLRLKKGTDFAERDTTGHVDIPRLLEGGVDLEVFACWIPTSTPSEKCRPQIDEMIDTLQSQVIRNADKIGICTNAAEAESLISKGKIAAFIGIENGVAIADDIANLEHYYKRGVRYMTLTHSESSEWCSSSSDDNPTFDGLTEFGKDVVMKMNELGMIIDVSHASIGAVDQVLALSKSPIIASHSCAYGICPHDRNLNDNQIKAIAQNGGVIGVNFYNAYLSKEWYTAMDSFMTAHRAEFDAADSLYRGDYLKKHMALSGLYNEMNSLLSKYPVGVSDVVDHIDYIVKLVGPDYVGLGSDFDGVHSLPNGLEDVSQMPNITRELVKRGYSEEDIRKILGGNFIRVFKQVCG
jgi:membrane dipeptidase